MFGSPAPSLAVKPILRGGLESKNLGAFARTPKSQISLLLYIAGFREFIQRGLLPSAYNAIPIRDQGNGVKSNATDGESAKAAKPTEPAESTKTAETTKATKATETARGDLGKDRRMEGVSYLTIALCRNSNVRKRLCELFSDLVGRAR